MPPSVAHKAVVDAVQVALMIAAEIRARRRRAAADAPAVLLVGAFAPGAGASAGGQRQRQRQQESRKDCLLHNVLFHGESPFMMAYAGS